MSRRKNKKKQSLRTVAHHQMRHNADHKMRKLETVTPKHSGKVEIDPTFLPFLGGGGGNPMGMLGSLLGGGQGGGQGGGFPFGGGGQGGGFPFGGGMPPMNPFGSMGKPPWTGGPSGMPPMNPFGGGQGGMNPFGGGMGGMNPLGMLFGGGGGGMGGMGGMPMNLLWNMMSRFLW